MTGLLPSEHGIVGNGWLFRDQMEVMLWRQSNRLVVGEKIWEAGKRARCSLYVRQHVLVVQHGAKHDIGVTPRPIYKADGRKLPDCYTVPDRLRRRADRAPGPVSIVPVLGPGERLSRRAAGSRSDEACRGEIAPTLTLVYFRISTTTCSAWARRGHPRVAASLREIDGVAGDLIETLRAQGCRSLFCRSTASPALIRRSTSIAPCARRSARAFARRTAASCWIRRRREPSRSRTTRSRTSMSQAMPDRAGRRIVT